MGETAPAEAKIDGEATAPDEPALGDVVAFRHPFFNSVEEGHFRKTAAEEPVFVIAISGSEAVLPIAGVKREFGLAEDGADARMLDLVVESLDYVRALRIGDPIPKEVLTGEPSWEVSEKHREIAYHRITMQLVSWISGGETLVTDPDELLQIAEDPQTKEKINRAFGEAARELGFGDGEGSKEQVVQLIEQLAEELATVEVMRERYQQMQVMGVKIKELHKLYINDQGVLEFTDPVARLIVVAVKQFEDSFQTFDAQTGEIMGVLKNVTAQIEYIKEARNDLHRRLLAWDDIIVRWGEVQVIRSRHNEDLLRDSYRFLAPRYLQADEWVLMTKLDDEKAARSSEMAW